MNKIAKAPVNPVRQRTQYSCMAASMSMCLNALGYETNEDLVNKVMGAQPMKGAAWEQALACAQHFGCRATLTLPCTVEQLKQWTDAGIPVMIAWNPEGRDWSHASVVFDVDENMNVYVADPNIPNPKEVVRVVPEDEFYHKWFEKFPNYLVRRPACAIEREITLDGRQIAPMNKTASTKVAFEVSVDEKGYARDDEGNTWFVGEEYAGYIGRGHDLPRAPSYSYRPPPTPLYSIQEQADKAILALIHEGKGQANHKNIGFLWTVRTWAIKGRSPTVNQKKWWDGLIHRTESFARKIPGKVYLESNPNGLILPGRKTDGVATRFIEDHFVFEGPFITGPLVKEAPPPPPPEPKPRPTPPSSSFSAPSGGGNQVKLQILDSLLSRRPDPFIQSIRDQVVRGKTLSEDQLKAVRHILYKSSMRAEADNFRMAKSKPKSMKDKMKAEKSLAAPRDPAARAMIERGGKGQGSHKNKQDYERGFARNPKHRNQDKEASYSGNPDGKPLYPNEIDHGYEKAIAGGTDVMQKLVKELQHEQGSNLSLRVAAKYLASKTL